MTPGVYSGLKLLPAVLVLLGVDEDPVARQAVRVERVQRSGTPPWTEDEVTIDWERLQDVRRGSTALRVTTIARSMLDDAPVDLREPHEHLAGVNVVSAKRPQ